MNAYLLLDRNQKPIASACGVCSTVVQGQNPPDHHHPMLDVSEACCVPKVCDECHTEISLEESRYLQLHAACRLMRAHARLFAAPLVPWPDGMVFCPHCDEYFDDESYFVDQHEGQVELKFFRVWACAPTPPLSIDADNVLETILDHHHEDAYDSLIDVKALQAALDVWCARQKLVSYFPTENAVDVSDLFAERLEERETETEGD